MRSGLGVPWARQARERGDADGDARVASVQGLDAQARLERGREVRAGGRASVGADGVGAGGGAGGGVGGPDRMAGKGGLPGAGEEHGEDREERHQLDGRLAFLAGGEGVRRGGCEGVGRGGREGVGHGGTFARKAVAALRPYVADLCQNRHKTEFPPFEPVSDP
jgi:hypothetical protein